MRRPWCMGEGARTNVEAPSRVTDRSHELGCLLRVDPERSRHQASSHWDRRTRVLVSRSATQDGALWGETAGDHERGERA